MTNATAAPAKAAAHSAVRHAGQWVPAFAGRDVGWTRR